MSIRVLLADDDPLVITGLRMLLAADPTIEVVGEADDGDAAVTAARQLLPDVVLMDIRMPRLDGVSALRVLMESHATPPAVVMLTTFGADTVVLDALRAGAAGFLLKHTPPEQIVAAVHAAATGEVRISPTVLRQLIDQAPREASTVPFDDPLDGLSDRERDVAYAVADGLANGEIAERLFLSLGSVKALLSSSLAKLAFDNRVQLAIAAHESRRHT